jgi:hypothetical protein
MKLKHGGSQPRAFARFATAGAGIRRGSGLRPAMRRVADLDPGECRVDQGQEILAPTRREVRRPVHRVRRSGCVPARARGSRSDHAASQSSQRSRRDPRRPGARVGPWRCGAAARRARRVSLGVLPLAGATLEITQRGRGLPTPTAERDAGDGDAQTEPGTRAPNKRASSVRAIANSHQPGAGGHQGMGGMSWISRSIATGGEEARIGSITPPASAPAAPRRGSG